MVELDPSMEFKVNVVDSVLPNILDRLRWDLYDIAESPDLVICL